MELRCNSVNSELISFPRVNKRKEDTGLLVHEIILHQIKIVYIENPSSQYLEFNMECRDSNVIFYYLFSGEGIFAGKHDDQIMLRSNEQTYFQNTKQKNKITLGAQSCCCLLQLRSELVDDYLKEIDSRWLFNFPSHNHITSPYQKHYFPITPMMRSCLEEILQSKRQGMFLKLQIESSTLRLLMLQFEQMENHDCSVFCSLKRADVDKVYEAKKIILANLSQWITVSELAKIVGTNEHTLKRGFKELFGAPIFEFIKNYKMDEARKMLYETEINISYISDKLGYKNVTHFSAAFKRKFGCTPRELKSIH